jgi:transposase
MAMRGEDRRTGALFSYVDLESRVRADHPLRAIREVVNAALAAMSSDFEALYSRLGRPGIAPERLLRALLLQCFYSVRSERQLMERLEFDLLFRWFVGLGVDDPVWDASVFSKNRDRLLAGEVAQRFLAELLALPEVRRLLSAEHFSVDGTLLQAWASLKSFRPRMAATRRRGRAATASGISGARSARTRPMPAPRTRTRGSIARAAASRPSSATSVTR